MKQIQTFSVQVLFEDMVLMKLFKNKMKGTESLGTERKGNQSLLRKIVNDIKRK